MAKTEAELTAELTSYLNWGSTSSNSLEGMSGTQFGKKLLKDALLADHVNFVGFTPHITGRFFIFVTKMPTVMEVIAPIATETFKRLIQFYTTEITGFQDLSMNTVTFDTGSELSSIDIPVGTTGETKELSITFGNELRQQPITRYITTWFRCIMDNAAVAGTYMGLVYEPDAEALTARKAKMAQHATSYPNSNAVYLKNAAGENVGLEYDAANHTMSFIVFTTNQARSRIERIAYIVGAYPKSLPIQASMDSTWNQGDVIKPVLQLGVQCHMDNASVRKAVEAAGLDKIVRGTMATDLVFYKANKETSEKMAIEVGTGVDGTNANGLFKAATKAV